MELVGALNGEPLGVFQAAAIYKVGKVVVVVVGRKQQHAGLRHQRSKNETRVSIKQILYLVLLTPKTTIFTIPFAVWFGCWREGEGPECGREAGERKRRQGRRLPNHIHFDLGLRPCKRLRDFELSYDDPHHFLCVVAQPFSD